MSEKKNLLNRINPLILIGLTAVISILLWVYGPTISFYILNPGGWQGIAERETWAAVLKDMDYVTDHKLVERELLEREGERFIYHYQISCKYTNGNTHEMHLLALFNTWADDGVTRTYAKVSKILRPHGEKVTGPTEEDIKWFKKYHH